LLNREKEGTNQRRGKKEKETLIKEIKKETVV
jgi:hypothetical protein